MTSSPGSPRAGLGGAELSGSPSVSSSVLSRGLGMRRESVRIVAGLAALLVTGVVALNVVLWRNAERQIERESWQRLEAAADVRRADVDHVLAVIRREAVSIGRAPVITALVHGLDPARPAAERERRLEGLASRVDDFEFRNFVVLDAAGRTLHERHPRAEPQVRVDQEAVLAGLRSGRPEWGAPRGGRLALATPVPSPRAGEPPRWLVLHADLVGTIQPLLKAWPGFGSSNGAYLVRAEGQDVRILTMPPLPGQPQAGTLVPMQENAGMAAAMAATGVASRLQQENAWQDLVWSVTRPLQNAPWGYVTQASRSEMMRGMDSVRQALASLDLILLAVFLAFAFAWRRSYTVGLARRELELTESHARRVQAIFDTAFDAILTFDRVGRVRTVNRAAEVMIGKPLEALAEQPIQRFLHWGPEGRTISLPQAGSVVTGEVARADGSRVPVEVSVARSGEGDALVFTAIVRDVRDRVEAEKRIRAFAEGLEASNRRLEELNAQLEESSRLKSEFLANTSHELRTPLNGMLGFLQLVLDGMCDSRDEEQEFLRQALQCSRHLLGLINDVLDIARIEAGKLALDIGRIELQQVFDEVYTVTHVQATQKGLKLEFEDQTHGHAHGRGDLGKVKQVLINLVGNSLKFTPRGHIRVRARAHAELGHVMIEVEDTGIGIEPERQKVVFDKFVQADGSTTRRYGGTGLGLAISKSLVELMGGIIGIHSDGEGRGTRVYFSLPLWRESGDAEPGPLEGAGERIEGSAGDPLVLVIEDDGVFRRFVTAVLQRGGFRTVEAENAEAGWVLVRRLRPAAVVLDYALSCQEGAAMRTGWDLARRMTTEPETRHIPVVFVTGFDGELSRRLHATSFSRKPAHLVKPVEPQALLAKITELAGSTNDRMLRVLMADDDPTVSAYVRKVLPSERFLVDVTNNGEECLHILRTQPKGYDILLLDLMMPEVSGYDVLCEMTLSGLHPDLPVLVLTNFPEPRNEEERRLLEHGMVLDVVSKSSVHENPKLLPHVLDWHLQVARAVEEPAEEERRAA